MKERLKVFIDHLIEKRKVFNVRDFGEQIGKNKSQMSCMLKGTVKITPSTAEKIKNVFPELNIDWLMTGEGDMIVDENTNADEGIKTSSVELLRGTGIDGKFKPGNPLPYIAPVKPSVKEPERQRKTALFEHLAGLVSEESFKEVCNENTQLRIENSRLRKQLELLMSRLESMSQSCDD